MISFDFLKNELDLLVEEIRRINYQAYVSAQVLRSRLYQNIADTQRFGDSSDRTAERNQIIFSLNNLSLQTRGQPFRPFRSLDEKSETINELLELLRLMQYRNVQLDQETEIISFEYWQPLFSPVKCMAKLVFQAGEVSSAIGELTAYGQSGISTSMVISVVDIADDYKNRIQRAGLHFYHLGELKGRIGSYAEYCRVFTEFYESRLTITNRRIKDVYVPLDCQEVYRSGPRHSLDSWVETWLADPTKRFLTVLGDYGSGKTVFCERLTYNLIKRFQTNSPRERCRLPILVRLRDYIKNLDVESIVNNWCNRYSTGLNYRSFIHLNREGHFLIIIDGFDEAETQASEREIVRNFKELMRLAVGGGKVVLTSRAHYFKRHMHYEQTVDIARQQLEQSLFDKSLPPDAFDAIYITYFSRRQIRNMLSNYLGDEHVTVLEAIRLNPNLSRIAQHPILLEMIVGQIAELGAQTDTTLDESVVYERFTDEWLKRDRWEYELLLTEDDRRFFMEALSYHMVSSDEYRIHYSEIPSLVERHFTNLVHSRRDIDHFDAEIRTCTFLRRDQEGWYSFTHKSFKEFFYASHFVKWLNSGTSLPFAAHFNSEIWSFVYSLVYRYWNKDSALWWTRSACLEEDTVKHIDQDTRNLLRGLAVYFLTVVAKMPQSLDLSLLAGISLQHTTLKDVDFSGANLSDADLSYSSFYRMKAQDANLQRANLEGVTMHECQLPHADCTYANLRNSYLTFSSFESASFCEANLHRSDMGYTNLERADFTNANLVGANLESANLCGAVLLGVRMNGANLKGANLENSKIMDGVLDDCIVDERTRFP